MCKYFFIFCIVIWYSSLQSQIIPNNDFENWSSDGEFLNPDGWDCSNRSFFSLLSFTTTTRVTDAYSGTYCTRLETIQESTGGEIVKMAGILTLGIFDVNIIDRTAIVKGGIPFTQKPTKLTGYYKYFPVANDSSNFQIGLTKFNATKGFSDTLGYGKFASSSASEWTYFEVPVEYNNEGTPDTLNIVFLSSDTSIFNVGSVLFIDSIGLEGVNSVPENYLVLEISIFPNPCSNILNVWFTQAFTSPINFAIYNNRGQIVKNGFFEENENEIFLEDFESGNYFILLSKNGKPVGSKMFNVN